eukprot:1152173-Pelagomonas_calceolata.AAC.2
MAVSILIRPKTWIVMHPPQKPVLAVHQPICPCICPPPPSSFHNQETLLLLLLHLGTQVLQFALLFAFGGFPAVVWGGALRMVWVYHITWAVNSVTHCWGNQQYNTGDLSRNVWCVCQAARRTPAPP